jgi:hypothetical protein
MAWELLFSHPRGLFSQPTRLGLKTFFQTSLGSLTLDEAIERVTTRLGITGRSIVWKHAEPGMVVDRPHQLELLRADLEKQLRKAARKGSKGKKKARDGKEPKSKKKGGAKKA